MRWLGAGRELSMDSECTLRPCVPLSKSGKKKTVLRGQSTLLKSLKLELIEL